jgi:hypothetical protein
MEKVFKILVVFGLLMIVIVYSVTAREKKFREYYFSRRITGPQAGDPAMLMVLIDRGSPRAAKDLENQLFFQPGERSVQVIEDLTGRPVTTILLDRDPHGLLFDGATRMLYACSAEGYLTIIRQSEREVYKIMQNLPVPQEVSVLMLDSQSGALYLQAGEGVYVYMNT